MPIGEIYYGANVSKSLLELNLTNDQIHFFRLRCLDFYVEACRQIVQRFPLKGNIIKLFNFLDPGVVKAGSISSITEVALVFPNLLKESQLQTIDTEWRLLRNTEEIQSFPDEVMSFWREVKKLKLGDGSMMFNVLSSFVFNVGTNFSTLLG